MNTYNQDSQLVIATIINGKTEIGLQEGEFQKLFNEFLKSKGISDARWEIFRDSWGSVVLTTSILLDGSTIWEPVFSKHILVNDALSADLGIAGKDYYDKSELKDGDTLYLDIKKYCDISLFADFKELIAGLILRDRALGAVDAALEPKIFIADASVIKNIKHSSLPRNFIIKDYASNDSSFFEVSSHSETFFWLQLKLRVGVVLPPVDFSGVLGCLQRRKSVENTVDASDTALHAYLKNESSLNVSFVGWQAQDLNTYQNGYFGFLESAVFWQAFFSDFLDLQPRLSIQKTSELTNGSLVKIITREDDYREKAYMYNADLFSLDQIGLALVHIADNSGESCINGIANEYLSTFIGMLMFHKGYANKPNPYNTDTNVTLIADHIYSIKRLSLLRTEEEAYLDVHAGKLLVCVSLAKQSDDPAKVTEYCLFGSDRNKKILVVSVGGTMESICVSDDGHDHLLVDELIESVLSLQVDSNFHEMKSAIRDAFYMFGQKNLFAVEADKV